MFTYGIELLHDTNNPILSALLLFFILLLCEILPMMIMLDYSYIHMIINFELNAISLNNDGFHNSMDEQLQQGHGMGRGGEVIDNLNTSNTIDDQERRTVGWLDVNTSLFSTTIREEENERDDLSQPLILQS